MTKREKLTAGLIACGVATPVCLCLFLRTHAALMALVTDLSERRPPLYFIAYAAAMAEDCLLIVPLVGVLVCLALLHFDHEPDWGAIDWWTLAPILTKLSHPGHDHGGGYWTPPGIIEQIAETYDVIQRLKVCDGRLPEAILKKWEKFDAQTKFQLRHLMDGQGDTEDWLQYYEEEYHRLLSELLDCIAEVTLWYAENNVIAPLPSPPPERPARDSPRNVEAKARTERGQSKDKARRGGEEVEADAAEE